MTTLKGPGFIRLPRLELLKDSSPNTAELNVERLISWANMIVDIMDVNLLILSQAAETGYTITNKTEDRVLDCNSTSTAELADVVGTLIDDLKGVGRLG